MNTHTKKALEDIQAINQAFKAFIECNHADDDEQTAACKVLTSACKTSLVVGITNVTSKLLFGTAIAGGLFESHEMMELRVSRGREYEMAIEVIDRIQAIYEEYEATGYSEDYYDYFLATCYDLDDLDGLVIDRYNTSYRGQTIGEYVSENGEMPHGLRPAIPSATATNRWLVVDNDTGRVVSRHKSLPAARSKRYIGSAVSLWDTSHCPKVNDILSYQQEKAIAIFY